MSSVLQDYLRWAAHQVGTQEQPRGSNRQPYAAMAQHTNGFAWCATFQVAAALKTGVTLPPGANTASCALNEVAYKRAGRLSTKPRVGSTFFVFFPSLGRVAHTGVVWKVAGNRVHTIEGNTNTDGSREGYAVCLRTRPISRATGAVGIRSYGMPIFEEDTMQDKDWARLEKLIKAASREVAQVPPSAEEIAEAMLAKLDGEHIVRNLGLRRGDPDVGTPRTVINSLAEADRKLDLILQQQLQAGKS